MVTISYKLEVNSVSALQHTLINFGCLPQRADWTIAGIPCLGSHINFRIESEKRVNGDSHAASRRAFPRGEVFVWG
jgi:hypothetical protein